MRVHLPLEDVYDPSLIYMHCDFCEPLVGFATSRWRLHLTTVYAHFTALFLWSTAPF